MRDATPRVPSGYYSHGAKGVVGGAGRRRGAAATAQGRLGARIRGWKMGNAGNMLGFGLMRLPEKKGVVGGAGRRRGAAATAQGRLGARIRGWKMGNAGNMLGFGLMRLPENEIDGEKAIDIEQVKDMVDAFMRAGFTYFDTAFGYHGGRSEVVAKEALVDRYPRESFQLATKLPAWMAKDADEAKRMFDVSLERTGAGYFDYYLLHNLGEDRTKLFDDFGLWDFAYDLRERGLVRKLGFSIHDKADALEALLHNLGEDRTKLFDDFGLWDFAYDLRERGLVRKLGFSIHDKADALEAVLAAHPDVDFVQLQINYADWESPKIESRKCYEVARAREVPVIVMEPIKGGSLVRVDFVQLQINYADWESPKIESRKCYEVARAREVPVIVMEPIKGGSLVRLSDEARTPLAAADPAQSAASWALRFAASLPGVERVLSGMSTAQQMRENIDIMRDFAPMTSADLEVIEQVRAVLEREQRIPCTDCGYCLTQQMRENIDIMRDFAPMTSADLEVIEQVRAVLEREQRIPCTDCGYCLKGCPSGVRIPVILESLNIYALYDDLYRANENYEWNASTGPASACIGCGACEDVCPQHIEIVGHLEKAKELFDGE